MKFRNYCLIVMGSFDKENIIAHIQKLSKIELNVLDAKGIMIVTFTSPFTASELTELLMLSNISFLIFDLNKSNSGFHITKKEIHDGLFGYLKQINLEKITDELIDEINLSMNKRHIKVKTKDVKNVKVYEKKITLDDIKKMTVKEKEEIQNKIIDNGVENMTQYDKKILKNLWK